MSHIGFFCPPFMGHLNPMRALGVELQRRAHRVTCFGISDSAAALRGSGLGFVPLGAATHPPGTLKILAAHMGAPRGLGLFRVINDMARMTDMLCREAPGAIAAHGVDALAVDQLEPAGGLIAAHRGYPLVSVANALPIDREAALPPPFTDWGYDASPWGLRRNAGGYQVADLMMGNLSRVIAQWSAAWQLEPRRRLDQCVSQSAQVTQLVSGFDFPRLSSSPGLEYCGPFRLAEAATDLAALLGDGRRPLAFASLGTLQGGRLDLFQHIAQACQALDLHLVVAHGGALTSEQEATLSGAPVVRSFVPQRALLAHAAVAITNGGLNTVLDALAAGVPLVTVPIAFEQGAIGARLEACGAGISLPLRRAGKRHLTASIQRALVEPSLRAGAARIAAEIAAAGGVAQAAAIVESLLRRERSVSTPARAIEVSPA